MGRRQSVPDAGQVPAPGRALIEGTFTLAATCGLAAIAIAVCPSARATVPVGDGPIVVSHYEPASGLVRIGPEPERAIERVERGHTLLLPPGNRNARGIVVFLDGWPVDADASLASDGGFDRSALARDVGVLHVTTGDPLDFLFEDTDVAELVDRVQAILLEEDLRNVPVFLAGMSLGGTRAARLAVYLHTHRQDVWLRAAGLAMVDAPLDMVRFWHSETRAARVNAHPAAADEGRWVTYLLETHLGGSPDTARDRFVAYSPFVHGEPSGGNAAHLREIPVRAYHEPDVDWWIENRRKDYYSMNSIDLAALVTELLVMGNDHAELITTHAARAEYPDASPHTWSIVDDGELVEWFLSSIERDR